MPQPMSQVQIILDANTSSAQRNLQMFQSQIGSMVGAVQNVNQGFINSARIINNFRIASERAERKARSLTSAMQGMSMAATGISAMFSGVQLKAGLSSAMNMVDDYRKQVLAIATTLTDTVAGDPDKIRDAFDRNTRHAKRFFRLLQTQSAKSIATFEELANAYQLFTAKGLSLTPTSASASMLANIVDRILLATKGQASNVQVFQELRAILNGTSRPGDVTASIFKMHDPNYLQRIRAIYQTSENPGTDLMKYLNTLTSGMDMSNVLGQLLSKSFARLKTNIHIWVLDAFSPLYDQLVAWTSSAADFLSAKNNPLFRGLEEVRDFLTGLAGAVKTTWDALGPVQGVVLSLAPKLVAIGSALASIAAAAYTAKLAIGGITTMLSSLGIASGPVGWGLVAAGGLMVLTDVAKESGTTYVDKDAEEKASAYKRLWEDFSFGFLVIIEAVKTEIKGFYDLVLAFYETCSSFAKSVATGFEMIIGTLKWASQKLYEVVTDMIEYVFKGPEKKRRRPIGESLEYTEDALAEGYAKQVNVGVGRRINFRTKSERDFNAVAMSSIHAAAGDIHKAVQNNDRTKVEELTKTLYGNLNSQLLNYKDRLNRDRTVKISYPYISKSSEEMAKSFADDYYPRPGEQRIMPFNEFIKQFKFDDFSNAKDDFRSGWNNLSKIFNGDVFYSELEALVRRNNPNYITAEEQKKQLDDIKNSKAMASRFVAKGQNFETASKTAESEYRKYLNVQRQLLDLQSRYRTEAMQYGITGRSPESSANIQLEAARSRIDKLLSVEDDAFGDAELKRLREQIDLWSDPAHQALANQNQTIEGLQQQYIDRLTALIEETKALIPKTAEAAKAEAERVASLKRADALGKEADRQEGKNTELMGKIAGFATGGNAGILSQMQNVREVSAQLLSFQRELTGAAETEEEAKRRLVEEQAAYNNLLKQASDASQRELEYQKELLRLREEGGAVSGVKAAILMQTKEVSSAFDEWRNLATKAIGAVQTTLSDTLFNIMTGDFKSFGDIFKSFVNTLIRAWTDMVAKMVVQWAMLRIAMGLGLSFAGGAVNATTISNGTANIAGMSNEQLQAIAPSIYPKANGGIFAGGFQAFANGGTVHAPTLGLVGEGRYNEAIVPLPDGRSIPVVMRSGSQPTVTVNINDNSGTETSKTVSQREDDDGNLIIDVVIDALTRNRRGFRRTLQQYAGANA